MWDVTNAGATARPLTRALVNDVYEGSVLAWGSATRLYSNDEGLSPSSLHRFTVGSTSFAETDSTYLDAVGGKITYSGGRLFSDGGGVVDPSPVSPNTPRLVGRLSRGGSNAVDTTINAGFFLDQNFGSTTSRVITAVDPSRFVTTGSVQLDNMSGDAFDLVRWGGDGIAFRTTKDFWGNGSGRVVVLGGAFVLPPSATPNPTPNVSGLSPNSVVAPGNTWVTVTGSNFVPGSVALWNGAQRTTVIVDSTHVRVAIPAADLAISGTANKIRVSNPAPGGGKSTALTFTMN